MRYLCLLVMFAARLAGCASPGPGAPDGVGFDLGPLPAGPRQASDVPSVTGDAYIEAGGTTTVNGTGLIIDATGADHFSYGLYACAVPPGYKLASASFEVQDVQAGSSSGFYIGYADYGGTGLWEWHGPYLDNAAPAFSGPVANYLSPERNFYFAVVAPHGVKVQFNLCWVQMDIVPVEAPPAGQEMVDQQALATSLAVLPATAPNISADAPVIAYIKDDGSGTKLNLAYYSQGQWVVSPLMPADDFARPLLHWLGGESILVAYDLTSNELLDIRLRQDFSIASTATIMANPGTPFLSASLDVDPVTGLLGIAHAYSMDTSSALYYSTNDGTGWQTGASAYSGSDRIASLSFRFGPAGGDPWLLFTHGTIDTSLAFILNFVLESGRFTGGNWQFTPVTFTDSPLIVRLNFAADNTPQVAFVSSRIFDNPIPPVSASLLFDIYAGSYSGSWSFAEVFHSTVTPHISIPIMTIDMDDATDIAWAASDALIYSQATGTIEVDVATITPTGGQLDPAAHYMTYSGGWSESAYFTGSEGHSFSWGATASGPAAAYILAKPIDAAAVFALQFSQASDLLYWSK